MLEFEERAESGAKEKRWEETSCALEEQTKTDNKRYDLARRSVYYQGAATPAVDAVTQEANEERTASLADTSSSMAAHPNKGNLRLPPSALAQSPPLYAAASSSPTTQPAAACSPTLPGTSQKTVPRATQGRPRHPENCQCKGRATRDSECQNIARGLREHGGKCICGGRLGMTICVRYQSRESNSS